MTLASDHSTITTVELSVMDSALLWQSFWKPENLFWFSVIKLDAMLAPTRCNRSWHVGGFLLIKVAEVIMVFGLPKSLPYYFLRRPAYGSCTEASREDLCQLSNYHLQQNYRESWKVWILRVWKVCKSRVCKSHFDANASIRVVTFEFILKDLHSPSKLILHTPLYHWVGTVLELV